VKYSTKRGFAGTVGMIGGVMVDRLTGFPQASIAGPDQINR
jgi:hypothetical protein